MPAGWRSTRISGRRTLASVLVFAVFCLGQGAAPATQTVPDFSGTWKRDPISMDLFEPSFGPGPLVNISGLRLQGMGNYLSPILKPWAAQAVKAFGEKVMAGNIPPDVWSSCYPIPTPYIGTVRGNFQLLQLADGVMIIYENNGGQVRWVRYAESHSAHVVPSWYGDSVGHYEGDTLVVDTIGIKVTGLSAVDRFGTPSTDALHVVERFKIVSANNNPALRIDFWVEDPNIFNTPWQGYQVFYTSDDPDWHEGQCAENNREVDIKLPMDTHYRPPL